jgi:ADP-heptose:LPS heptosyltransferase
MERDSKPHRSAQSQKAWEGTRRFRRYTNHLHRRVLDAAQCILWLIYLLAFVGAASIYAVRRLISTGASGTRSDGRMRICLITCTDSWGDAVIRSAIVKILHLRHPAAHITLATNDFCIRKFGEMYIQHSWVNELLSFPLAHYKSPVAMVSFLLRFYLRRFDLCVMVPHLMYDTPAVWFFHRFLWLCRIPQTVGYTTNSRPNRLVRKSVQLSPRTQNWSDIARAYDAALGGEGGADCENLVPFLRLKRAPDLRKISSLIIAVHAGGHPQFNRRWPLDRYAAICLRACRDLGAAVFLVGGYSEFDDNEWLAKTVLHECPTATIVNSTRGDLQKTLNILADADLFVGNDSGPMHMAVGLGTPSVGLFGPSDIVMFRADRLDQKHTVLFKGCECRKREKDLALHDCGCPRKYDASNPSYPRCLMNIEVAETWSAIKDQLTIGPAPDENNCHKCSANSSCSAPATVHAAVS